LFVAHKYGILCTFEAMGHNPNCNIQVHCSTTIPVFRNETCTKVGDCLYHSFL
jgi:hypothetical protein